MTDTCSHHDCVCEVADGDRYCSDYCREASENSDAAEALGMSVCRCGHLACLRETGTANAAPGSQAEPGSSGVG